ncbi:hypothetical protein P7C70_g1101, partial [Phenoliferia sp. Uapishka_3]
MATHSSPILPNPNVQQTTSCAPCRSSHRACRPADPLGASRWPCSSCPGTATRVQPPSQPAPGTPQRSSNNWAVQRSVIGPSSVGWRMSSHHLSYALSFHLVQVDFSNKRGVLLEGFPGRDSLEEKFGRVGGRASELPLVEEVAFQMFVTRGSRYSSHSLTLNFATSHRVQKALVGRSVAERPFRGFAAPESEDGENVQAGISRSPIQASLLKKLGDLLEHLPLVTVDGSYTAAFERLVLAYIALAVLFASDNRREVHRIAGVLLTRGLEILDAAPLCSKQTVQTYLSDIAVKSGALDLIDPEVEIGRVRKVNYEERLCELKTLYSTLPIFDSIFPRHKNLPHLYTPSAYDLDLITSWDPGTLDAYEKLKRPRFDGPMIALLDEVTRLLSYFAANVRIPAVRKCWNLLSVGSQYIHRFVQGLDEALSALSPRSRRDPPGRESDFINHIFLYHLSHLQHFWSCHLLLEEVADESRAELLQASAAHLDIVRSNVANHTRLLMAFGKSMRSENPRRDLVAANKLIQCLFVSRGPSLTGWCQRNPAEARHFLRAARVAAYGYPEASMLALELQGILGVSGESPRFVIDTPGAEVVEERTDAEVLVSAALQAVGSAP